MLFYGDHKNGKTLAQILNKETFNGVLIKDDATVYQNFSGSQKCWAHLIRKAIKLTLQDPDNKTHRTFADGLMAVYPPALAVYRTVPNGGNLHCSMAIIVKNLSKPI